MFPKKGVEKNILYRNFGKRDVGDEVWVLKEK